MGLAVNDTNFDEIVLSSDKPVVVDFWAEWCGPCKMIGPYIEQIAEEYKDRAIVVKCDVDSSPAIAKRYMIRNIPTVLYFKNGEIADKQVGAAPKSVFAGKLAELL